MLECSGEIWQMEQSQHSDCSIAQGTSSASVNSSGPRRLQFGSLKDASNSVYVRFPGRSFSSRSSRALMCEVILEDGSLQHSASYCHCISDDLHLSLSPFAVADHHHQQQQQQQQQSNTQYWMDMEQQLRQAQMDELLNKGHAGSMPGEQQGWQQLAGHAAAMNRSHSNSSSTTDGGVLSGTTDPMFSIDYSFDNAIGAAAAVSGVKLFNSSGLDSMPSTASDADWSSAVISGSSLPASYGIGLWEAPVAASMSDSRINNQQQQQQFSSSNSGICNHNALTAAHMKQQQQQQQQQPGTALDSLTGGGSPSQKQFAAPMAAASSSSSSSRGIRSLLGTYTYNSSSSGSSSSSIMRGSSPVTHPLQKVPVTPALHQQLLAQLEQQQYMQQQQQQQQALRALEDELLQLQQLGIRINAARAAAAPGSAAASSCDAAVVKHTAVVKHALAAKAALQVQLAAAAAAEHTALAPARVAASPQQQQLRSAQSVPSRRYSEPHATSRGGSPYVRNAAAAYVPHTSAGAESAAAAVHAAAAFHRSISGPVSGAAAAAAHGKLVQLVKIQQMQAALQGELLQLLPMA